MGRTKSLLRKQVDFCTAFEIQHLGFLNLDGGTEFWSFYKETREVLKITKGEYERTLEPDYNFGDRGRTQYFSRARQTFTIKSDWLTEYEYRYLDRLLLSISVFLWREDQLWPIIITQTTWNYQYQLLDKVFQATITYEPSWRINTDRL